MIQAISESGTCVNYGEKPNGDIVIDSMNLGPPYESDFHPAWLLNAAQETADALHEEMSVGEIQSFEDAIHRDKESNS